MEKRSSFSLSETIAEKAQKFILRSSEEKTEAILVRSAAGGNSAAFEELVKRYHRRVTALGMSFFRNIADTEDFVQDVFIKAYTKLRDFRGESRFSTWLFRIAYTTAVNSIKRRKEYLPLADENLLWDRDYTPEELQIRRLTIETVRDSIKELPQRFALCLDMYFFYDMAYGEICEVTGLPLNTVKSHIFRAKKLLKEKLEQRL
ncbi:MAG: sigma-70 family RNA polymerase sigma factor [Spirochaetaceae bacterium]|nr:sigma-70 family RNA polymerase sigma factor [Spirochaetaceae bacterium]MBO5731549.1 sigma-70 family RNA polymerase sigma factor [Treponema sp.]